MTGDRIVRANGGAQRRRRWRHEGRTGLGDPAPAPAGRKRKPITF